LKRRSFIKFAAITGAGATGVGLYLGKKNILQKNIKAMPDELAMLRDVELRRNSLGQRKLIIKGAAFDNIRFDEATWENTEFIDCHFYPDSLIFAALFKEVHFENCIFYACRLTAKRWENVSFHKSSAREKFEIRATGKESKGVTFNACDFIGTHPNPKIIPENEFGVVGAWGDVEFNDCNLEYVQLIAGSRLSVNNSKTNMVDAGGLRENGELLLNDVKGKNYLDVGDSQFSNISIKNCIFEDLRMENVKANEILMDSSKTFFLGHKIKANSLIARDCIFHSDGDPNELGALEYAGFSTLYAKIKSLHVENVQFTGHNGSLFIGGAVNLLYDPKEPKYGSPLGFSNYETIVIRNTSLKRGFLAYTKAKEVEIDHCEIIDANFTHAEFENLRLKNVNMGGTVDFKESHIQHVCNPPVKSHHA
jgi:uncharacterized protein YjbI with pentapeptide repeats